MGLQFLSKYRETGLLLLRSSVGLILLILTAPVLMAGSGGWRRFGSALRHIGFESNYEFWGFLGVVGACAAGVFLIIGLWFRGAALVALFIAAIHASAVWSGDPPLRLLLVPLEFCLLLVALIFIGPGKYSVDKN